MGDRAHLGLQGDMRDGREVLSFAVFSVLGQVPSTLSAHPNLFSVHAFFPMSLPALRHDLTT
jgi:hypothetical protein